VRRVAECAVICRGNPFLWEKQGVESVDTGTDGTPGRAQLIDSKAATLSLAVLLVRDREWAHPWVGDVLELAVDVERRNAIRRKPLGHPSLALGPAHGAGRARGAERLAGGAGSPALDFSHLAPLSPEEKQEVEDLANARVLRNCRSPPMCWPIAQAKQAGAIAFFARSTATRFGS